MVDSFATVALETLRDLLIEEVKFLSGVSYQVEEVRRELQTMHCFLKDADKRQDRYNSQTIRNWVAELQDLAYKAEDVLEKYAIEVTSKRGSGKNLKKLLKRFTCILGEGLSVHQIGKETEDIRSQMANLTKKLQSITKEEYSSSSLVVDVDQRLLRQTYAHEVEEYFVGMKEDIDLLVSHSINDDRSHRVISICGMGGLGKTTLARKIYQHEDVQSCFEARAWVCVTQQFQVKTVFEVLLKQLLPKERKEEIEKMNEVELVTQLYNLQKEKKCLVILDDIWEINHWNILCRAFPIAEACCKILLTTRNERIANTEFVHKLKCLSAEESWDLLQKIALPINYAQVVTTVELELLEYNGKEMIRKCGCLPLAISVIGGILRQRQLWEWEKVNKNMDSYLKHGDGVQNDGRVENVLNLSYNVLPYYLKLCFLYLGCYSEDEDIEVVELYSLWIAEGMVSSDDKERGENLRDVAERYLSELASRCMVQVKMHELSTIRRFKSCRLHDLIRDLCLSKGKEEDFLEARDYQRGNSSSICRTRGLAIHFENSMDNDDVKFECGGSKSLRSLLLLNVYFWNTVSIKVSNLGMLKSLKILKLEGLRFKNGKLPSEMEKLILLKHLSIKWSMVNKLPRSVCNLPCLQYLDLRTFGDIELPNVIHKLGRLRHLLCHDIRSTVGGEKLKLNGLIELETMIGFHSEYADATHLHKLTNLRRFYGEVSDIESLSVIVDHITNLKDQFYETSLIIRECDFNSETGSALLRKMLLLRSLSFLRIVRSVGKLPAYEPQFCQNLVELILVDCKIEEDLMEIVEKFLVLGSLELRKSFVGREMICRANGFPQLKSLYISGLNNLEEWRVDEKAMPKLSYLRIKNCTKLEMIPDGLRFITTLQDLVIEKMPKEFNDKLRVVDGQTGKDYDKIKHIPNITLLDW